MLFSPALIAIGIIGPILGLSLSTSIIITIFATIVSAMLPAFTATLSPPTGLRQIAVARYSFGIWGAKLCGFLNILGNCGFAVISSIFAGQLLRTVSDDSLPLAVGIIILVALSFVVSFFGYHVLHTFERYAWILIFILLCVQYGQAAPYFSDFQGNVSGLDHTGSCLTYFSIIFGTTAGWCGVLGDYYVHYPPRTNKWMIFCLTMLGIIPPTVFVLILGDYYGSVVMTNKNLNTIYESGGVGALTLATLNLTGFGKFICVMYTFSFLGNVIVCIYSSALCIQLWGAHFQAVPRFIWNTILSAIILALAWGGRDKLEQIIGNFLALLGYWTLCFARILAEEHFIFRARRGYDVKTWQYQSKMPVGIAAVLAFLTGIARIVLGMDQTWYVGVVARKIGTYGGDTGIYFALVFCGVLYPAFRTLELKYFGR